MPDASDEILRAAVRRLLMDGALQLLQKDPHSWSERPCPTCRQISAIVGRPFGCYLYMQQQAATRARKAAGRGRGERPGAAAVTTAPKANPTTE